MLTNQGNSLNFATLGCYDSRKWYTETTCSMVLVIVLLVLHYATLCAL